MMSPCYQRLIDAKLEEVVFYVLEFLMSFYALKALDCPLFDSLLELRF
jgi:hypothetical protein